MRMFEDREAASRELATHLGFLASEDVVVMGIPNGGIVPALHVCQELGAPLDLLILSRLAAPRNPDHIVGAVDEYGRISLIEQTARWHHLTSQKMIGPAREIFREVQQRRARFRAVLAEREVRGKTVVVVNDGVADGASMLAAIASVKDRGATKVIAAAPVGQQKATWALHEAADMVVIPHIPDTFRGVHKCYKSFPDISDEVAVGMIQQHVRAEGIEQPMVKSMPMQFMADGGERWIYCEAEMPQGPGPFPAVIFAHGFESDCRSPRSIPISRRLAKRGVVGVRMDFQGHGRSDGSRDACTHDNMLSDLATVFENLMCDDRIASNQIGLCGSGTGGMVALAHAAKDHRVEALVVRGPICGGEAAAAREVDAPTLLIHSESDESLARDIERINELLPIAHQLLRIPECNRLFNDPISLELMVGASVEWLYDHLRVAGASNRKTA